MESKSGEDVPFCAFSKVNAYIFLHVVGHLGQVSSAVANFFLHIHHNQSGIRVVLKNRAVFYYLVSGK